MIIDTLKTMGCFPPSTGAYGGIDQKALVRMLSSRSNRREPNAIANVFECRGEPNGIIYAPTVEEYYCVDLNTFIVWKHFGEIGSTGWLKQLNVSNGFPTATNDGDPQLPSMIIYGVEYGLVSYVLSASYNKGSPPVLTISYPSTFYNQATPVPGSGTGAGGNRWPIYWMRIQRSTVDTTPGPASIVGYSGTWPFYLTGGPTERHPPVGFPNDPNWITIQEYNPTGAYGIVTNGNPYQWVDELPLTFPDVIEPTGLNDYRIFMALGPLLLSGTWNTVILAWNSVGFLPYQPVTVVAGKDCSGNTVPGTNCITFALPAITWT